MSYHTFNPDKHPDLERHIKAIRALTPGQFYLIKRLPRKQISQMRTQFYSYLDTNDLKQFYQISRLASGTSLMIFHKYSAEHIEASVENAPDFSRIEEIYREIVRLAKAGEKVTREIPGPDGGIAELIEDKYRIYLNEQQQEGNLTLDDTFKILDRLEEEGLIPRSSKETTEDVPQPKPKEKKDAFAILGKTFSSPTRKEPEDA